MTKINCWEYMCCGREPGGKKVEDLGVCPASTAKRADGANSGKNGGRVCWVIAGTRCGGEVKGTFATQFKDCLKCEFFKLVCKEEEEPERALDVLKILGGR